MSSGIVYDEVATHRKRDGVDDVLAVWKGWASAFPDVTGSIDGVHVAGNTVILELTWRGIHSAVLRSDGGDIPATGKRIEIRACQIVDVADGQVQRVRQYFDMATMMRQLGLATASV